MEWDVPTFDMAYVELPSPLCYNAAAIIITGAIFNSAQWYMGVSGFEQLRAICLLQYFLIR